MRFDPYSLSCIESVVPSQSYQDRL